MLFPTKNLYNCSRCGETFWLELHSIIRCIDCGNTSVSRKTVTFDANHKNLTIENVVYGIKDNGIIRIKIKGERKKGLFSCNKCSKVYEQDCTNGLQIVNCPECKSNDFELKSPIASVIGSIKGIPQLKTNWTKAEIKLMKFAKACFARRLQIENTFDVLVSELYSLEVPNRQIGYLKLQKTKVLKWIDNHHDNKISAYESNIDGNNSM